MRKVNVILRLLNLFNFSFFFLVASVFTSTQVFPMYFPELCKREFSETFPGG